MPWLVLGFWGGFRPAGTGELRRGSDPAHDRFSSVVGHGIEAQFRLRRTRMHDIDQLFKKQKTGGDDPKCRRRSCPICKVGQLVCIERLTAEALACLLAPMIQTPRDRYDHTAHEVMAHLTSSVRATGDPCPNPPLRPFRNTAFDCHPRQPHPPEWEGDHLHRRAVSSPGVFPGARQAECHSIPMAHVPAQFYEFYR